MRKTNEMEKLKNSRNYVGAGPVSAQKGITLIALIITIIVMLILVSVTISMAVNGGLFEYAGKSVSDTENAISKEQELAGGQVQIDGEWYDSIDDYLAGVESVKSLQEKHEFKYYSSLVKAVTDVNNNTRENADAEKENAVAGIYTENGKHTVVLLKNATEETRVEPKVDMTINLGGHILSTKDRVCIDIYYGNITIDGNLNGSTVENTNLEVTGLKAIQIRNDSKVNIYGGTYIINTENADAACISTYHSSNIIMSNVKIRTTETDGKAKAIEIGNGTIGQISNCDIKVHSNGIESATSSVCNFGTLTINNCNIMGIKSAVQNTGELYVNGGIYEGFIWGGFMLAGEETKSYIRNATIRECEMPEGYTATIASENTGMYIGAISADKNIKVYVDNCDIYGSKNPIIINYGTNNALYISNSRINTDKQINIGTSHKLYIGVGNNFTAENTNNQAAVVKTEEVYVQEN